MTETAPTTSTQFEDALIGVVGEEIDVILPAVREGTGQRPFSYSILEDLPAGIQFDGDTRRLYGTFEDAQDETTYTEQVEDSAWPHRFDTREFSITVYDLPEDIRVVYRLSVSAPSYTGGNIDTPFMAPTDWSEDELTKTDATLTEGVYSLTFTRAMGATVYVPGTVKLEYPRSRDQDIEFWRVSNDQPRTPNSIFNATLNYPPTPAGWLADDPGPGPTRVWVTRAVYVSNFGWVYITPQIEHQPAYSFYQLATSQPDTPQAQRGSSSQPPSTPTGWQTAEPDPTATHSVWQTQATNPTDRQWRFSIPAKIADNTDKGESIIVYRLAASVPSLSANINAPFAAPMGWSTTALDATDATETQGVYSQQFDRASGATVFVSQGVTQIAPPLPSSVTVYGLFATAPGRSANIDAPFTNPAGWDTTVLDAGDATPTQGVYSQTFVRATGTTVFVSQGVTEIAPPADISVTVYGLFATAPSKSANIDAPFSAPDGWDTTVLDAGDATPTQGVYSQTFVRATGATVFVSQGVTGISLPTPTSVTVYGLFATAPSRSANIDAPFTNPAGWDTTVLSAGDATPTQGVYSQTFARATGTTVFVSQGVTQIAPPTPATTVTVYGLFATAPAKSANIDAPFTAPAGWDTTVLDAGDATPTQGVYSQTFVRATGTTVFVSQGVTGISLPTPTSVTVYGLFATAPSRSANIDAPFTNPAGWDTTVLSAGDATATQGVYSQTFVRATGTTVFVSQGVTQIAPPTPATTEDIRVVYRLSVSAPTYTGGNIDTPFMAPTGWSEDELTKTDATRTEGVYSLTFTRAMGATVYIPGTVTQVAPRSRDQTINFWIVQTARPAPPTTQDISVEYPATPTGWLADDPGPSATRTWITRAIYLPNTGWLFVQPTVAYEPTYFFYQLATSQPDTPQAQRGSLSQPPSTPAGWQTTEPNPTATHSVWQTEATNPTNRSWRFSTPTEIAESTDRGDSVTVYQLATSIPSRSANIIAPFAAPTGWSTTALDATDATETQGVYSQTFVRARGSTTYVSQGVTEIAPPIPLTVTVYGLFATAPGKSSNIDAPFKAPAGWDTIVLDAGDATPTQAVYSQQFDRTTGTTTYVSQGITQVAPPTPSTVTVYGLFPTPPPKSANIDAPFVAPQGWNTTELDATNATATEGVYSQQFDRADGSITFISQGIKQIAPPTSADSITVYGLFATAPAKSANIDAPFVNPSGWNTTQLDAGDATPTEGVYSQQFDKTPGTTTFVSQGVDQIAPPTPYTAIAYGIFATAPSKSGDRAIPFAVPTGWTEDVLTKADATPTHGVYSQQFNRAQGSTAFVSQGVTTIAIPNTLSVGEIQGPDTIVGPGLAPNPATTHQYSVAATDPEMDTLTYAWSLSEFNYFQTTILSLPDATINPVIVRAAPGPLFSTETGVLTVEVSDGLNTVRRTKTIVLLSTLVPRFPSTAPYYIASENKPDSPIENQRLTISSITAKGYSTTKPNPTLTKGVWVIRGYEGLNTPISYRWTSPSLDTPPTGDTGGRETVYQLATSAPSYTGGNITGTFVAPAGWLTSKPSPTTTQGVYALTFIRASGSEVWVAQAVIRIELPVPETPTDTGATVNYYRQAQSRPDTPADETTAVGDNAPTTPTGWSTTDPGQASVPTWRTTATRAANSADWTFSTPTQVVYEQVIGPFYRRGTSTPATPTATTSTTSPSGWSQINPGPTATENVYITRGRRPQGSTGNFTFDAPTIHAAMAADTGATVNYYRQAQSRPDTPADETTAVGDDAPTTPTGWSTTDPGQSGSVATWRTTATRAANSADWTFSTPTQVVYEQVIGPFYRRGTSTPSTPTATTSATSPSGWSQINPGPTATENVYITRGRRPIGSTGNFTFDAPTIHAAAIGFETIGPYYIRSTNQSVATPDPGTTAPSGWSATELSATATQNVFVTTGRRVSGSSGNYTFDTPTLYQAATGGRTEVSRTTETDTDTRRDQTAQSTETDTDTRRDQVAQSTETDTDTRRDQVAQSTETETDTADPTPQQRTRTRTRTVTIYANQERTRTRTVTIYANQERNRTRTVTIYANQERTRTRTVTIYANQERNRTRTVTIYANQERTRTRTRINYDDGTTSYTPWSKWSNWRTISSTTVNGPWSKWSNWRTISSTTVNGPWSEWSNWRTTSSTTINGPWSEWSDWM